MSCAHFETVELTVSRYIPSLISQVHPVLSSEDHERCELSISRVLLQVQMVLKDEKLVGKSFSLACT